MVDQGGGESPVRKTRVVRKIKGAPKRPKKQFIATGLVQRVVDLAKDNARAIALAVGVLGIGWIVFEDSEPSVYDFQALFVRVADAMGEELNFWEIETGEFEVVDGVLCGPITRTECTNLSEVISSTALNSYDGETEIIKHEYRTTTTFEPVLSYTKLKLMTEWIEDNADGFEGEVDALWRKAKDHFKKIPNVPLNHPLTGVTD